MNIDKENLEAIIQRYILDQLDERDAEDFEAYFLCRPEIADAVSTAQRLSVGLHAHQDAKAQKASSKEPVRNAQISFLGRLTQMLSGPAPSFVMAALLLCATPFAIKGLSHSGSVNSEIQLISLESSIVRSGGQQGLNLSTNGHQAAVVIRVKSVEYPSYVMHVREAEMDQEVWTSEPFRFSSGSRDALVLIPRHASIANASVKLYGMTEDGREESVNFCNYTESCF